MIIRRRSSSLPSTWHVCPTCSHSGSTFSHPKHIGPVREPGSSTWHYESRINTRWLHMEKSLCYSATWIQVTSSFFLCDCDWKHTTLPGACNKHRKSKRRSRAGYPARKYKSIHGLLNQIKLSRPWSIPSSSVDLVELLNQASRTAISLRSSSHCHQLVYYHKSEGGRIRP